MNDTIRALLPLLLLVLAFVVLVGLPMRARSRLAQQTRATQETLAVGAYVMTTSGLFGRVVEVADDTVELEVAPDVVVRWARAAIAEIRDTPGTADAPGAAGGLAAPDLADPAGSREPAEAPGPD